MTVNDAVLFIWAALLLPFAWIWKGFVVSKLWLWFLVPLGLTPIGIAHSCGLLLFMSAATMWAKSRSERDKIEELEASEALLHVLSYGFLTPALYFGVAFIFHITMGS